MLVSHKFPLFVRISFTIEDIVSLFAFMAAYISRNLPPKPEKIEKGFEALPMIDERGTGNYFLLFTYIYWICRNGFSA